VLEASELHGGGAGQGGAGAQQDSGGGLSIGGLGDGGADLGGHLIGAQGGDRGVEVGFEEVPQYAWPTDEALAEGILEADRALAVGAMEYVPDEHMERVLGESTVHPWTMAQQGAKWRACHDYSVGTNRRAASAPFALPTVWDVRPLLKPSSRFAKYDLRDGFYLVPVHPDSRHRLCGDAASRHGAADVVLAATIWLS
jgi:hypothetical protein